MVTERKVILQKGTRDILPCRVAENTTLAYVIWHKGSTFVTADLLVELYFLRGTPIKDGDGYTRGSYDIHDNYSLVIENVSVKDNEYFFCEVVTLSNEIYTNQTNVIVFGKHAR